LITYREKPFLHKQYWWGRKSLIDMEYSCLLISSYWIYVMPTPGGGKYGMRQSGLLTEPFRKPKIQQRLAWMSLALLAAVPVWRMTATALAGNLSLGDAAVRDLMLQNRWPVLEWAMLTVSWLGSEYAYALFFIIFLLYLWRRERDFALWAVGIMASSTLWQILLKRIAGRLRPEPLLYPAWQGAGYPSGHALTALVVAYMMWRISPCLNVRRPVVFAIGCSVILWPLLVGFSRIYLNAHYLGDVTAGLLLGIMHIGLAFAFLGTDWLAAAGICAGLPEKDK
jgi:membrane-associated phospholipid phosphatase